MRISARRPLIKRNPVGVNGEKIAKFSYVGRGKRAGKSRFGYPVIHYQLPVVRGASQGRPYFLALR